MHQSFRDGVARVVVLAAEILFHNMAHDVKDAGNHLPTRQGERKAWIEDRKLREDAWTKELAELKFGLVVADDAAIVHLAACADHCQNAPHGNDATRLIFTTNEILLPRIFLAPRRGADGLRIVNGRAATDSENEIDVVGLGLCRALHHLLARRIRRHASVLDDRLACRLQRRDDLIVDPVPLDRAAAI